MLCPNEYCILSVADIRSLIDFMTKATVSNTTSPLLRIKERNAKLREMGILPMFYKFEEFIKETDHYNNILSGIDEIPLSSA